jgi:hypothetical protein
MGLFDRIKDPVPGVARVITSTGDPGSSEAHVTLSVQPDGMAATSLDTTLRHPAGLAPQSGELLPVIVDRKHPDRIEVDWDGVRRARATGAAVATSGAVAPAPAPVAGVPGAPPLASGLPTVIPAGGDAAAVEAAMAAIPPEARAMVDQIRQMFPQAGMQVESMTLDANALGPALRQQIVQGVEQATGRDLDGDGLVGTAGGQPPGAAVQPMVTVVGAGGQAVQPGADSVSLLERLAKLHESGAITDEEFEQQKAKILGT